MKRALAAAVVLSVLTAGGVMAAAPSLESRFVKLPDGRRIHMTCSGIGSPTVLLEPGYGADAGAWYKVQPLIARTTRVCSYDRAGLGESSMGPLPRDGRAIAHDLDAALRAAKMRGPFIMVGHSAGALYVRQFATLRIGEVAGMVLVDPSVEHQTARYGQAFGEGAGSIAGIRNIAARCVKAIEAKGAGESPPDLASCGPGTDKPAGRTAALNHWRTNLSEIETLFAATSDQVVARRRLARRVPTIVLTAASVEGPTADRGEIFHRSLHAEVAANFESGQQRLVKSSHMMIFDRPEVIAAAVDELARASRRSGRQRQR
jgi:pimeloyl-ACP methyl ester carboxylesterase